MPIDVKPYPMARILLSEGDRRRILTWDRKRRLRSSLICIAEHRTGAYVNRQTREGANILNGEGERESPRSVKRERVGGDFGSGGRSPPPAHIGPPQCRNSLFVGI